MGRSRSAGAKVWATVLSELAGVAVVVEWESPAWHVRWVDGPTERLLQGRAEELDVYGVGAPLPVKLMGFSRRVSQVARAVGWLVHGSRVTESEQQRGMTADMAVEDWCTETSYPLQRAGADMLAAARVLAAVSRHDAEALAALMAGALPPLGAAAATGRVIEHLPGRVASYRWPGRGGAPLHLLRPPEEVQVGLATPATLSPHAAGTSSPMVEVCRWCGAPLPAESGTRGGRPALYCSDRCRVAAHRDRTRAATAHR